MGKENTGMSLGMIQKWLMGYNKPNSWDNKICFVEQDCYSYYSSVTEGPFTVLDTALNPEILVLLPPLSGQTSQGLL